MAQVGHAAAPYVSIIVPVRNEEGHISDVLSALQAQDYPRERVEVIVSDGMSTDSTRHILGRLGRKYPKIAIIDNPEGIVPTGLNRAIRQTHGDIIVRIDSHASYPSNYVSALVRNLTDLKADNVGGRIETFPYNDSAKAHAIAASMSNSFGVGDSHFRIGTTAVREVDTVPFGCFRREVFNKIGLFDEDLVRNQDDEFNARMRKHGMKVYLVPDVVVTYYARDTFTKLFRMFYQYGYFKPLVNKKLGLPATMRQFAPLCFVLFIVSGLSIPLVPAWTPFYAAGLAFYLMGNLYFSWGASKRGLVCLLTMYAHLVQHVAYGTGYLVGILDFLILGKKSKRNAPLSR